MNVGLISNIKRYKEYYLVISDIHAGESLTVLNSSLHIIAEYPLKELGGVWNSVFHIDDEQPEVLISITSTGTFSHRDRNYQGFNVHWYCLKESKGKFRFDKITTWKKSEITKVLSKKEGEKRYWICLKQLISVNEQGHVSAGGTYQVGIAITGNKLEIPDFLYPYENQQYIKTAFDFIVKNDSIYIAAICGISWSKTSILKIGITNHTLEAIELDIPLKKLHHFEGAKMLSSSNSLFAYFWSTSQEYCKKYNFNITKVCVDGSELSKSTFGSLNSEEFIHEVKWSNKNIVSYKKVSGEPKTYIIELDEEGNENRTTVIENWKPVFIDDENNTIVVKAMDDKSLRIIGYSQ